MALQLEEAKQTREAMKLATEAKKSAEMAFKASEEERIQSEAEACVVKYQKLMTDNDLRLSELKAFFSHKVCV